MGTVEVSGARLWYDEAGSGTPLLLLHGGLGDSRLWEPVVPFLAEQFRTIRTDLRFYGGSTGPAAPWSWQDDVIGVLDALGLERVALAGLSLGGRLALDIALDSPERITALALVAPGVSGHDGAPYTADQEARYEAAEAAGEMEAAMEVDFEVWAPLGADDTMRELWWSTPDAQPLPAGIAPLPAHGGPAIPRLDTLAAPTLVVTVSHDPSAHRDAGLLVAKKAPGARHVELDSDHYVTLREPELVARTLLEFLRDVSL